MEKKTIGTFLAALRKASGMTQKQLAEKLNVSDKAVSRWERDECAPDLTLIPVLAEIYGVTADEILRGQRRDPEATDQSIDKAKATKQRQRLLASTWLRFKVQSIISIAISIIGLIAASVCNFDLYQAHVGFMAGSVFFLTAGVCQIIFLTLNYAALSDTEWEDDAITDKLRAMVYTTEAVLSFTALLLASCIPLAGTHRTVLPFSHWMSQSKGSIIVTAIICAAVVVFLNWRLGYFRSPKNRLRLRCGIPLGIMLALLMLLQLGLGSYLPQNRHLIAPCTRHETRADFLTYIETPVDPEGNPMEYRYDWGDQHAGTLCAYYLSNETGRIHKINISQEETLDPGDGRTPITGYHTTNLAVSYIEISDTDSMTPIYTFTESQYAQSEDLLRLFDRYYPLIYLLPLAVSTIIYLIQRRKLPK